MEEKKGNNGMQDPKLDAIKQIIFGENMVEYDQKFTDVLNQLNEAKQQLESQIKDTEAEINKVIAAFKKDFENRSSKIESTLEKEITRLDDKKTDRKALGKMLQNIGEKLQA